MKRTYKKPQIQTIPTEGPILMLQGTEVVNVFKKGNDIVIGDEDEPTEGNTSSAPARGMSLF